MQNIPVYLKDSYLKELNTSVSKVLDGDGRFGVVLDDTVFYPEGGGQPCDQGTIQSDFGTLHVNEVKLKNGEIVHFGKLDGNLEKGQDVQCEIDWDRRYRHMIIHTAGHLIDEALYILELSPDVISPVKASHSRRAYIEYVKTKDALPENLGKVLSEEIEKLRKDKLPIHIEFVSKDSIKDKARWLPPKLPTDKPLRIVSFGDNKGIPDGGTLSKNTSEIPPVKITDIDVDGDCVTVKYSIDFSEQVDSKEKAAKLPVLSFDEIENARNDIANDFDSNSPMEYEKLKTKYLGKKGLVKNLLRSIGSKSGKDRASFGQEVNKLRSDVEEKLKQYKSLKSRKRMGKSLTEESIDVTAPFDINTPENKKPQLISIPGSLHPITQLGEKALSIFRSMGFHVTEARRLDSDYNVFEALNIPKGHPARDMWDTFWTEGGLIPTTHTSAMQNRILSGTELPIREVIVGRCFRNEATDASHEHTFYQVEGVYVDKDISLADLIGTMSAFVNEFYGKDVKYKIQPSYFPFVEPGLEFLIECMICGQKGCPFCGHSGWVEVIPCGPIHPNVLKEAGLDPKKYSGFAWGLGYDRLVMLGSQVQDIRNIHGGNLKFLEQFK